MNLGQLRSAVRERAGVDFGDVALNGYINEALQNIATQQAWGWLEATDTITTGAGMATYDPPWGWTQIRAVNVDGVNCSRVTAQDLDDTTVRDFGFAYAVRDDRITLFPTPGGVQTVQVRYLALEEELTHDSDEPRLPEQWHRPVLVPCAAYYVLQRVGEMPRADEARRAYEKGLKKMQFSARRTTSPHLPRVRPGCPY